MVLYHVSEKIFVIEKKIKMRKTGRGSYACRTPKRRFSVDFHETFNFFVQKVWRGISLVMTAHDLLLCSLQSKYTLLGIKSFLKSSWNLVGMFLKVVLSFRSELSNYVVLVMHNYAKSHWTSSKIQDGTKRHFASSDLVHTW